MLQNFFGGRRSHVTPPLPAPSLVLPQLCDGASEAERAALRLKPAKQFRYLSQSNCFDLRGVSNAEEYRRTRRSMSVVGIPEAEQVRALHWAPGRARLQGATAGGQGAPACACIWIGSAGCANQRPATLPPAGRRVPHRGRGAAPGQRRV